MAGHPLRRPVCDLPGPGWPDRFDPLGDLRGIAPGLRHPPDGGDQARRPALDAAEVVRGLPQGRSLAASGPWDSPEVAAPCGRPLTYPREWESRKRVPDLVTPFQIKFHPTLRIIVAG